MDEEESDSPLAARPHFFFSIGINIRRQMMPMNFTIFLKMISFKRIFDIRIKSNFFIIFVTNHSELDFCASGCFTTAG